MQTGRDVMVAATEREVKERLYESEIKAKQAELDEVRHKIARAMDAVDTQKRALKDYQAEAGKIEAWLSMVKDLRDRDLAEIEAKYAAAARQAS